MSRGDPVFEPLEAFVERWFTGEPARREKMVNELRMLIAETDRSVKLLAAGYGMAELMLENKQLATTRDTAIELLRYEIDCYYHHRKDCDCDACEFLERVR